MTYGGELLGGTWVPAAVRSARQVSALIDELEECAKGEDDLTADLLRRAARALELLWQPTSPGVSDGD